MRRRLPMLVLIVVVAVAAYWILVRDRTVEAQVQGSRATATIGSGSGAIAVGPEGQILTWFPLSAEQHLPTLPLSEPPKSGKLSGPVLEQARVLGAAPAALRPYIESSYYGETGVDVKLRSGIELRFGDDTQAGVKWKAAAAILADPSTESLDYVDLHAPHRSALGGSGHTLPPVE
jgi:cell division protein FtsQ